MRMVSDCRLMPGESNCTLTIAGEEEEVVRAASEHAVAVHGHADELGLRNLVRRSLRPEAGNEVEGYGTTMIARLRAGAGDQVLVSLDDWERDRHVPGFVGSQLLLADDGETVVNTAVFTDRDAYLRLADDPAQDEWWRTRIQPLLDGEPTWIDGRWSVFFRRPVIVLPTQAPAPAG